MTIQALRPWTDLVKLHPDVEGGALMEAVLASLAGKAGYNRVLKPRTPFGRGRSHTLASLGLAPRVCFRRTADRPAGVTIASLTHFPYILPQPRPSHQSSQGSPLFASPSAPA
ncbi:hypothetical protein [Candidatus Methylomirabilis sp.]|uniref:hypothetical protein n=1 Tax=Candidatus Methylomirabilis sp. TaxID=2032687 RepID=UPI002A610B00|nr:hypothetical protein [Candidatus Methylomirabilis sp.]